MIANIIDSIKNSEFIDIKESFKLIKECVKMLEKEDSEHARLLLIYI